MSYENAHEHVEHPTRTGLSALGTSEDGASREVLRRHATVCSHLARSHASQDLKTGPAEPPNVGVVWMCQYGSSRWACFYPA